MSYILDALKKAEAERERGQVPGINAAAPAPQPEEFYEGQRLPSWVWAVLGALMMLIAALVWSLTGRDDAPAPVQSQAPEATTGQPPMQASAPAPLARHSATTHLPEQAPAFEPEATLPEAPLPAPTRRARQLAAPQIDQAAPDAEPSNRSNAKAAPKAGANKHVYTTNELPEDIRQALPTMQFGGAMYSDQPSSRMLIINSKAFHEGDHVMADLVLREIQLRSAVLVFRGYAYSVSY
jgi:general secretion pathway protein B